jgi:CheY-like chemotaxis protein
MERNNRYLVVDDSPTVRRHLSYLLKLVGSGELEILEAETPAKALLLFRKETPSVVFLDMMLPKENDGIILMTAMLKERADATIVLVTALDQNHESVRSAIAKGAVGYLRKPLTVAQLQGLLTELEAQSGRFRRVS